MLDEVPTMLPLPLWPSQTFLSRRTLKQALRPDLVISVGTAGGFAARGAAIGDVFVATGFANHDRRIPLPVRK